MTKLPILGLVAGLALAAGAHRAAAEPSAAEFAATTLSLAASGEAHTPPDMASLTLGVETTRDTAGAAMRENAVQMTRVIASLKAAGLQARDLRTSSLSLSPQYVYAQGQPPRLSGYQASNQVEVTIRDLARLGAVADAVVGAGATNVGQISFGLANPAAAENMARLAAVKALEDKAGLYAQATGYHIVRLVSLSEGAPVSQGPRPMMMAQARMAEPTPVEAGESTTRIEVEGLFELAK